jgi:hypothetical protein
MKPKDRLPGDNAGRFRTTHWVGMLLTAQVPDFAAAFANLYWQVRENKRQTGPSGLRYTVPRE